MTKPAYGTPEWERADAIALCWSRNVNIAVYDFIQHNMSRGAARAALLAMPVRPEGAP
jgi:aspartate oxidase